MAILLALQSGAGWQRCGRRLDARQRRFRAGCRPGAMNEAWLLERYQATELAARHWHVQCMNLQEQRNAAQLAAQHWHATAQHNFFCRKAVANNCH
jgi:hypothetical protein